MWEELEAYWSGRTLVIGGLGPIAAAFGYWPLRFSISSRETEAAPESLLDLFAAASVVASGAAANALPPSAAQATRLQRVSFKPLLHMEKVPSQLRRKLGIVTTVPAAGEHFLAAPSAR